jgi:hypothetical protein
LLRSHHWDSIVARMATILSEAAAEREAGEPAARRQDAG